MSSDYIQTSWLLVSLSKPMFIDKHNILCILKNTSVEFDIDCTGDIEL